MRISLCLLTFNEITGCKNDFPQIKEIADRFEEIYAIDAGSQDGTIKYLKKQGIPVYIQPVKGLNAACHYAVKKCSTDAVIFFHPKGAIPVADLLKFRKFFEKGYEFVIGSRIATGAHNEEDDRLFKPRKWFVETLALFAGILYKREGRFVWDVLHGFRGATLSAWRNLGLKDRGKVTIDIEMVIRSYKKRIKRIEFPTTESPRLAGKTHFKAIPTGMNLMKYLLREMKRRD